MKAFAIFLEAGSVAILLVLLLFASGVWLSATTSYIGFSLKEIEVVLRDPETQWVIFVCFGIYSTVFILLKSETAFGFCQANNPNLWLACILLVSTVLYAMDYPSIQALTLIGAVALGQSAVLWAGFETGNQESEVRINFKMLVVFLLLILLTAASVWNANFAHPYQYRNQARWAGPWENPNIFGLLMGTGVVLALGLGVGRWKMEDGKSETASRSWRRGVSKYAICSLCLFAAILTARGLLHSYSRGAWIAAFCGIVYLVWRKVQCAPDGLHISWFKKNWLSLFVILASVFMLSFWHFRQTDWHPVRRAFSSVNAVDFSWRNRVAAWEGTLQITAEHPWFGVGWNQSEPLYEHYYLPTKLNDSAAIEMNDYLMFSATLGIPMLFCFGMYLWLMLIGKSEIDRMDWLKTVCHAGTIVLLIGFWFDGGLFKLPTAATFWILLELGLVALHKGAAKAAQ